MHDVVNVESLTFKPGYCRAFHTFHDSNGTSGPSTQYSVLKFCLFMAGPRNTSRELRRVGLKSRYRLYNGPSAVLKTQDKYPLSGTLATVASGHCDQLQTADPRRPPESISRSQVPSSTNVTYGSEKIDWSNQYFLDSFEDRPCQQGVLLTNRTYAILEPTP